MILKWAGLKNKLGNVRESVEDETKMICNLLASYKWIKLDENLHPSCHIPCEPKNLNQGATSLSSSKNFSTSLN